MNDLATGITSTDFLFTLNVTMTIWGNELQKVIEFYHTEGHVE
jgi:hypothetical protein